MPGGRPTKSQKWPVTTDVIDNFGAYKKEKYTTDQKGCVRTNQRSLCGKTAYVILDNEVWTCKIDTRGTISSIGAVNAEKTVSVILV